MAEYIIFPEIETLALGDNLSTSNVFFLKFNKHSSNNNLKTKKIYTPIILYLS